MSVNKFGLDNGEAPEGTEQGGKVSRSITLRRMHLVPGRGGHRARDGVRLLRRLRHCLLNTCVCSLPGKAELDQLTQN